MQGRSRGAVTYRLWQGETQGAVTEVRRFSCEGARSVVILLKAASGTPTVSVGGYIHHDSTREATLANVGLVEVVKGTVAAGMSRTLFPDTTTFASASEIPVGVTELDLSINGAVTDLDAKAVVLY